MQAGGASEADAETRSTPSLNNHVRTQAHNAAVAAGPSKTASAQNQPQTFGGTKIVRKAWHSVEDLDARTSMVNHIVDLLKIRRPNATEDWTEKLPQMAKRLEDALYHSANSAAEYKDRSTLKQRLQQLALAFPRQKGQSGSKPAAGGGQAQYQQAASSHMPQAQQGGGVVANKPSSQQGQQDEHRKQVLKQQQQRLLLLRHASKCPHESKCPVTLHCASMKVLWKHIMTCKEQQCKVAHCVSSRYVLSHYSKCKDEVCPVCAPVRAAIQRNYQRTQQVLTSSDGQGQYNMHMRGHNVLTVPRSTGNYPVDPVSCTLYCFTQEQVDSHFKSIHEGMKLTASKVRDICMPMLDEILKQKYADSVFGSPVDPVNMKLTDYSDIIKIPMDLGTIRKRLDLNYYRDLDGFKHDVNLCFDNAILYNPKANEIATLAKDLKKLFDTVFKRTSANMEADFEYSRSNINNCLVCGDYLTKFEPPVYYCNGSTCGGQRIRRNAIFYCTNRNDFHWCSPCFSDLKDGQPIKLAEYTVYKRDLLNNKKKLTESDEPWVQCDGGCERWVHQVCALFNSRRNLDDLSYICPNCLAEK